MNAPIANSTATQADDPAREDLQQQLDDALADTFPASDPVSFLTSQTEEFFDTSARDPAKRADGGERDLSGVKRPAE